MGARLVLKITEKQTGRRIAVYIHWGSEGMSSVWNIESFAEAYAKKINHSSSRCCRLSFQESTDPVTSKTSLACSG